MEPEKLKTSQWIDVGHGVSIGVDESGRWSGTNASENFKLETSDDFRKLIVLLEFPYEEVMKLIVDYRDRKPGVPVFPVEEIVRAGLNGASEYWVGLALAWFRRLDFQARLSLIDSLRTVSRSKRAGQKYRQIADRELRLLERSR